MIDRVAEVGWAIVLVGAAFTLALPMWAFQRSPATPRTMLLIGQGAVLFALPWAYPYDVVPFKVIVTLTCCAAIPPKLFDTYLCPGYWHDKPLREWIVYLLVPFVLVPRLHVDAPMGWAAARKPALRGALEMSLGAVMLWLAFQYFDSGGSGIADSFWVEHAIKLLAAYLLVFDGGFVMATALVRLIGIRTLEFSRNPALAATPADFWRRYNCEAGRLLREDVFYPLGGRRRPIVTTILTFAINGLLHEYLALIMTRRVTGYQFLFFALHGLATAATLRLRPHRWPPWSRIAAMSLTVLFLYFTTILFFATPDLFPWWYQVGGILVR